MKQTKGSSAAHKTQANIVVERSTSTINKVSLKITLFFALLLNLTIAQAQQPVAIKTSFWYMGLLLMAPAGNLYMTF